MSVNNMSQQSFAANALLNAGVLNAEVALDIDQQIVDQMLQNVQTQPRAQFDEIAHIHHHHHHEHAHKTAGGARLQRAASKSRKQPQNAVSSEGENGLHSAAANFVNRLSKKDEGALDQALDEQYDELSQYFLLDEAKRQVKEKGLNPEDEERLNKTIDRMMDKLSRNPRVMAGKQEGQSFCQSVDRMRARSIERTGVESGALRELRTMLGSGARGRHDEPLSAFALAKSMQGVEDVDETLSELGTKFAGGARNNRLAVEPTPVWLSFRDMASIAIVRTSFKIAGEIRRNLSDKANVTPKQGQMNLAVVLLALTELAHYLSRVLILEI